MLSQNTSQHGVPFDPAAAKAAREREARKEAFRKDVEAGFQTPAPEACLDGTPKQHARYLDQMNAAWRERARDRGRS